ncbi:hypothetical protein K2Z83_17670 [Oscillochloris sp. ZM17-4]|uniref:type II toxin-antitoxin system HicB family antitoxin n=1 Tax=Oscillochloris sp. ZM17-4 TaxID=2866714 RepID=UPI001C737E08|nr:hypothetical protein [Oscillochloris sp. ZM17-4]MBX0329502.1 hypothetical protein [Oscillochloris sp. ZM17-4]
MTEHHDAVFAPIDYDHVLERVAGGNETEVYRSDDGRYVVKLKPEEGDTLEEALASARQMRAAADLFCACMGAGRSIPSSYLLARDSRGEIHPLVIQPFLEGAQTLADLDLRALGRAERAALAAELTAIIGRASALYRRAGIMPDLYGRTSGSRAERRQLNGMMMLPWRIWGFLVRRTLLRSHNLMRTADGRLVLVDYDTVRRGALYRGVYFLARYLLFFRDRAAIWLALGA